MSKGNLVDALPYIDQGYEDIQDKQRILYMIDEETKRYRNTKNYLDYLGKEELNRFETDLMRNEFDRIEKEVQMEKFDMSRYEIPEPIIGRQKDLATWQKCIDNGSAQLEHQQFRILNLKLMDTYGTEAWKTYIEVLDKLIQFNKTKLIDTKRRIQETNYERKTSQEKAGEKLKHLDANWVTLVSRNFEIEQACLKLDNEISMLEKYHQFSRPGEQIDKNEDRLNDNKGERRDSLDNEDEPNAKRQKTDDQE